ncbi:MAG TPA: type IV secretion system protein [Rickettsiales bacterium]|nr:type IV secretion system protein [Rickettsiales bacterium]
MERLGRQAAKLAFPLVLIMVLLTGFLITAGGALACDNDGDVKNANNDCRCMSYIEGKLTAASVKAATITQGNGYDIVNGVFEAVNVVMRNMSQLFYTTIVQNPSFQHAVSAVAILYIAVYGAMIMYGLAPFRPNEVSMRLMKLGILWGMVGAGGWTFFSQWIGDPAIAIINQLITLFSQAGGSNITPNLTTNSELSPVSINLLVGSMNMVFSMRFCIAIIAMMFTGAFGWFFALMIIWGIVEFLLMIIGAIITYVKAIVALSFLFALAPIFFAFILFEHSKKIFMQYANTIGGYFIQPILLFGFIGFYASVLTSVLADILFSSDYCKLRWFSIGFIDIDWWRPIQIDPNSTKCLAHCGGGFWIGNPTISVMNIFYFLLLTHMGKNLAKFIESMTSDITQGYGGAGVVRGSAVQQFLQNHIPGVKGRSPTELIGEGVGRIKHNIQAGIAARKPVGGGTPSGGGGGDGGSGTGAGGGGGGNTPFAGGSGQGSGAGGTGTYGAGTSATTGPGTGAGARKATPEELARMGLSPSQGRGAVILGEGGEGGTGQNTGSASNGGTTVGSRPPTGTVSGHGTLNISAGVKYIDASGKEHVTTGGIHINSGGMLNNSGLSDAMALDLAGTAVNYAQNAVSNAQNDPNLSAAQKSNLNAQQGNLNAQQQNIDKARNTAQSGGGNTGGGGGGGPKPGGSGTPPKPTGGGK